MELKHSPSRWFWSSSASVIVIKLDKSFLPFQMTVKIDILRKIIIYLMLEQKDYMSLFNALRRGNWKDKLSLFNQLSLNRT